MRRLIFFLSIFLFAGVLSCTDSGKNCVVSEVFSEGLYPVKNYAYDTDGNLSEITYTYENKPYSTIFNWTGDRIVSIHSNVLESNKSYTLNYNSDGMVSEVTGTFDNNCQECEFKKSEFTYDGSGKIVQIIDTYQIEGTITGKFKYIITWSGDNVIKSQTINMMEDGTQVINYSGYDSKINTKQPIIRAMGNQPAIYYIISDWWLEVGFSMFSYNNPARKSFDNGSSYWKYTYAYNSQGYVTIEYSSKSDNIPEPGIWNYTYTGCE